MNLKQLTDYVSDLPHRRILLWAASGFGALVLLGALFTVIAWWRLPDVSSLENYQPKLPLRVFTADGALIGEFGEERRQLVPLAQMPRVLKDAVLATEDARFYQHGGLDYRGLARAVVANTLTGRMHQGASTITQQVARNMFLTNERTFSRKYYEALLSWKLEQHLSKDQILEIYLNQIYLGNRAYGFAAASQTYFGKPVQQLTVAEAAMLAGLPKAPGTNNPVANPRRAVARQQYVIQRMVTTGYLTDAQGQVAKAEPLKLRDPADPERVRAEFVAEMVRQQMFEKYGEATYTRGLKVYTTILSTDQQAAYAALRTGLMNYEQRQPYRGPEGFVPDLPTDAKALDRAVDDALGDHPDNGTLVAAVVVEASARKITAIRANGDSVEITGRGLQPAQSGLAAKAPEKIRIRPGSIIRLEPNGKTWEVAQLPEVEGAFVSIDPHNGAVLALVGGFDFNKNKFNHVTQAWRQPGSSFKPFIYSAALEKGFSPSTLINDAPLYFDATSTGDQPWEPNNYDGSFEGPMTMRTALQKSKNLVTVRVLQAIGPHYAQEWISRFGFDPGRHPAFLTMGLGAGAVTPMQMASAYAVFANGGVRVQPQLITRITDARDQLLEDLPLPTPNEAQRESMRAISARNAFVMDSLLNTVVKSGTGYNAYAALRRDDLYGKTGTTNDSFDAWFAGFQPSRVGIAWVGYDTPRQLGVRGETGGSVALPVWTAYMKAALKGVPVESLKAPEGVTNVGGDWIYGEYADGGGVETLDVELGLFGIPIGASGQSSGQQPGSSAPGMGGSVPAELGVFPMRQAPAQNEEATRERNRILDWFR